MDLNNLKMGYFLVDNNEEVKALIATVLADIDPK